MITSKLTINAQTTIPRPVRAALDLQADDPFRTFHEWSSAADAKAYGKL